VGPPGPAGPAGTEIVVPNEAALAALAGKTNGISAFVETHRSVWRVDFTSTLAPVPHVVIPNVAGGNWIRTAYADPTWREEITDVYLDPNNSTGIANDENHAIFGAPQAGNARQPLLTMQELFRRWGTGNVVQTGDPINLTVTIHLISGQPLAGAANDPLAQDFLSGLDTYPLLIGEAPVVTLGPIALGAFTPQNPSVPAPGGTAPTITIGATVWGPFIGHRIRRTSDSSVAYVLKDLGAGQARISQPQLSNQPFGSAPTNVAWAPGDVVVVENLTDVNVGEHFRWGQEASPLGFLGQYGMIDVNIINASGADPLWAPDVDGDAVLVFLQSTSDRSISQESSVILDASCLHQPFFGQSAGYGAMYGGALVGGGIPAFIAAEIFGASKQFFNFGTFDFFTYVQGSGVIFRGMQVSGTFSIWDAPAGVALNVGGHALQVGGPPNIASGACNATLRSSNPIFGSGSTGKGVRVASGSKISAYLALPNITGGAGDLQLADSVIGLWGDFASGTYQPPGGIPLTWAAVAAPAGAAGFGGSAHNHDQDAHVNKASAT
jgi:hypothetical protein